MIEGTLEWRGDSVLLRKCCGTEVFIKRYLEPLFNKRVRLEQHCDGSFHIVPVDRDAVRVNKSPLPVQHGEHIVERRPTTAQFFEEVVVCRVCGRPVGGM